MEDLKIAPGKFDLGAQAIARQIIEDNAHKSRTPREVFVAEELLRITKPLEDERLKEIEDETMAAQKNSPAGIMRSQTNILLAEVKRLRAGEDARLSVLKECRALFAEDHAISRFNWSESFLRAQDIRELNELPGKIDAALRAAIAAEGESEDAT